MMNSMLKLLKPLLIALVVANLAACTGMRDRRDAQWDPKPGQALFEQLPNWEGKAMRQCGVTTDRC